MARQLDRHRHFAETFGDDGPVRFHQDGIGFNAAGHEVVEALPAPTPPPEPPTPAASPLPAGAPRPVPLTTSPDPSPAQPKVALGDDMRLAANKAVKMQWEAYNEGEPWPGIVEARAKLGIA